jgi:hypothetical protein
LEEPAAQIFRGEYTYGLKKKPENFSKTLVPNQKLHGNTPQKTLILTSRVEEGY